MTFRSAALVSAAVLGPLCLGALRGPAGAVAAGQETAARILPGRAPSTDMEFMEEIQERAARFFWERSDPVTGLTNDRAANTGKDSYTVASIASTGYALASLPISVKHGWRSRKEAEARALRTLKFVLQRMPHDHGWLYHFIDRRNGKRVWNSEISTVDTSLLVLGALACGQYFGGEVKRLANRLYDRLDWTYMRTHGGTNPGRLLVSHGRRPESGFISHDWDGNSEGVLVMLLGLGAKKGLKPATWDAWKRNVFTYAGRDTFARGPIFLHQMPLGYFKLKGMRDRLGDDYWVSAANAVVINEVFCGDNAGARKTYAAGFWGLNASDGPDGYKAHGAPEPEDGTVSPTGVLASLHFLPDSALDTARAMRERYGARVWGRFGFANAFNLDRNWFGPDVIGIDLGMALLAIENHRSGLIWRLMSSHPFYARALAGAGFRQTEEEYPRRLRRGGTR